MSSKVSITVANLGKCYQIYDNPSHRLLQMFFRGRRQLYREFWALREASFTIQLGETVGIIGRNGSGKSTLLQMICGTVAPTTGRVQTQGRLAALLELGAGFNVEFTGRENIMLNAAILGISKSEICERLDDILAFSELGEFIDQPVKTYSSGMYARLAFSIAINVNPEILIVDEALAVGDARFVAKCMRRIKNIQQQGTTILFVSHDITSIRTLCSRVIWLDKGKLIADGEVFPITGRYMEFMFQDNQEINPVDLEDVADVVIASPPLAKAPLAQEATLVGEQPGKVELAPITHWGSQIGIIRSAFILNAKGVRQEVYEWGESVEVVINLVVPKQISRQNLSVAFSIKDLKGTDLIVSTTHDYSKLILPDQEVFKVAFKFKNSLVTGKYLLVVAVENRQFRDIHYYEYIEGIQYFSCLANNQFFGIFQPDIKQIISFDK